MRGSCFGSIWEPYQVRISVCTYVWAWACVRACVCVCVCACVRACVCVCIYVLYMYIYIYIYIYILSSPTHVTYTHICTATCVHVCTMPVYVPPFKSCCHKHTQKYIPVHTQTFQYLTCRCNCRARPGNRGLELVSGGKVVLLRSPPCVPTLLLHPRDEDF
jgi:hypothetical protein